MNSEILEDRSQYYLMDGFNQVYQGELENQQAWQDWVLLIREISAHCKGAMLWEENLHEYNNMMEQVKNVYEQLKQEMQHTQ